MGQKIIPLTLIEALNALTQTNYEIVAGGSDKMLQRKNVAGELPNFDNVMFITNIDELHYEKIIDGKLHIGATMTLEEILNHRDTPNVLKACLRDVASANIRHFATLPGNVANASPAGDTIVVQVLLNAEVKLTSAYNSRFVKVEDFVQGVRKIDRKPFELIEEIIIPLEELNAMWYKVGSRKAETIAKMAFAGAYRLEGNLIKDIRLCFGSVFIKAVRFHEIEDEMIGLNLVDLEPRIEEFVLKYSNAIAPIDDLRSSKNYKRCVSENIVRKFLSDLAKGGK